MNMNTQHMICGLAIVALLVLLYRNRTKEGFGIPQPSFFEGIDTSERSVTEYSPSILALSGAQFRGGSDFSRLVAGPVSPAEKKQDTVSPYTLPTDMMPVPTMDNSGGSAAGIPNDGNIIAVNLSRSKFHDCISDTFNLGYREGVTKPVNSVHSYTEDYFRANNLLTGTEMGKIYDAARSADGSLNEAVKALEMRRA